MANFEVKRLAKSLNMAIYISRKYQLYSNINMLQVLSSSTAPF